MRPKVVLHGAQKAFVARFDDRAGLLVRSDDPQSIDLALGEQGAQLLELFVDKNAGAAAVDAEGDAEADAERLRAGAREVLTSLGWKSKAVDKALDAVIAQLDPKAGEPSLDAIVRGTLAKLMER